jgi:hypothetical protein
MVGGELFLSARTQPGSGQASKLLQDTLLGLGSAGGHAHRAGGKIPIGDEQLPRASEIQEELRRRWLDASQATGREGVPLLAPAEPAQPAAAKECRMPNDE